MKIAVKNLLPNPFRHLERYPIDRDKVEALKLSIKDTTFWDNLMGRASSVAIGKYELAYGHHRKIALEELGVKEIDIPIRDLSDEVMLKVMAHENREEWAWSADIGQETVRAVIEAFGEGLIKLPKVKDDGNRTRYAPFFQSGGGPNSGRPELAYTAEAVREFLRWPVSEVEAHLNTLAMIEKGLVDQEDFKGLTAYQAQAVATQVKRAEKTTDKTFARKLGKTLAQGMHSTTGMKSGKGFKTQAYATRQPVTVHTARSVADEMMRKRNRETAPPKPLPLAAKALPDLAKKIEMSFSTDLTSKIEQVIEVRHDKGIHPHDLRLVVTALRDLAKRANKLANQLEG